MSITLTIVGQGYVGLPLAQAASAAGIKVWGLDVSQKTVDALNDGKSHIDDLTDEDIQTMRSQGYEASTDPSCVSESDYVVICVPTPLAEDGAPDLFAVKSASRTVGNNLSEGTTVILESTTYPGTTEEICLPLLEEESGMRVGADFHLAFSPERVDPGSKKFGIKNTPKLVGGHDEVSTERAVALYTNFIDEVVPVRGTKEAETAKLLENTFRHVNIALVNEMAKFCHELGIDIWEVIRGAATKPFGFMKFTPGPGVGGHCIPIDPNYLSYEVRKELGYPFRFVELAQEINNSMPAYVVSRIGDLLNQQKKPLNGSKILLLGVTYKPGIADERESPAVPLADLLLAKGAEVTYHDQFVKKWTLPNGDQLDVQADLNKAIDEADVVVMLQPHEQYSVNDIAERSKCFFDTRGVADEKYARL